MSTESKPVIWRWRDLCCALGVEKVDGPDVRGISIDSRTLQENDLFVALSGDPRPEFNIHEASGRDGHSYIASAETKGAAGALVHHSQNLSLPNIKVADTFQGLWQLAAYRRKQWKNPVVALTGSSGKTTLKSFLTSALLGNAADDSLNNHIGVPLSLVRNPANAPYVVVEIGTNHFGEIRKLSNLTKPTIAVVLNVTNAHIGNFDSQEQLIKEKLSIASGLEEGGVLVLCRNLLDSAESQHPGIRLFTFGVEEDSDITYRVSADEQLCQIKVGHVEKTLPIPGGGQHRGETLAAAAAVLLLLNEPLDKLKSSNSLLPAGRGQTCTIAGVQIIDESYNANPASMRECLRHLTTVPEGRRIGIVGNMNELGEHSQAFHVSLVPLLNQLDGVVCVGDTMLKEVAPLLRKEVYWGGFEEVSDLHDFCAAKLRSSDNVLVKGSNTVFWKHQFVKKLAKALESRLG